MANTITTAFLGSLFLIITNTTVCSEHSTPTTSSVFLFHSAAKQHPGIPVTRWSSSAKLNDNELIIEHQEPYFNQTTYTEDARCATSTIQLSKEQRKLLSMQLALPGTTYVNGINNSHNLYESWFAVNTKNN